MVGVDIVKEDLTPLNRNIARSTLFCGVAESFIDQPKSEAFSKCDSNLINDVKARSKNMCN